MPNMLFTNNAATTLASSINNSVTSLTVATGTGALFPTLGAGQYFFCTLANTAGTVEIIKVTARSGDTFSTIIRGQDGTSATSWNSGDKVELRLVNADLTNFPQLDSDNTFAGTQTFSNTITGSISGNAGTATTAADLSATLAVNKGGTGQTTYTNGQLLIGNSTGNTLTKSTLTAGSGISITNSAGSITIANTAGGQLQTQIFTAPGTWTNPGSVTRVKVSVIAGGGGGGSLNSLSASGGRGGFGGYAEASSFTIPTSPVSITVGSGGAGATGSSQSGSSGNSSSFGPYMSATGGGGGGSTPGTPTPNLAGASGAGTISVPVEPTALDVGDSPGTRPGPGNPAAIAWVYTGPVAGAGGQGANAGQATGGVGGQIIVEWIG